MRLRAEHLNGPGLAQVSLEVAPGECVALVGPPGNGGDALLRLLVEGDALWEGQLLLGGVDISSLPARRRPIRLIGPADRPLRRSVSDLLGSGPGREALAELLGLRGLEPWRADKLAPHLQWRALLATALADEPAALLLDEPGHNLAPAARADLFALLGRLRAALGLAILVAVGEPEAAFALADRVGVMQGGRLIELGSPAELYLRPQTEVGALSLGPANLLVGQCADDGVRVGPFVFPTGADAVQPEAHPRVQLLFRPEDVELVDEPVLLRGAQLGQAEVVETRFAGALERLRLRIASIAAVRQIAPPLPFGEPGLLIEATRPIEQARRAPLRPGALVWTGVRRFHALPHPGLHLALVGAAPPAAERLAALIFARVSRLNPGEEPVEQALARLHEQQPCDIVALAGRAPGALDLAARLLAQGEQHLLLIHDLPRPPASALVCVAGHEHDKATVRFAGRLLRHLGARATLLTILDPGQSAPPPALDRFHTAARDTLAALGVPARSIFRAGHSTHEIATACREGGHDLVVLGAPADRRQSLGLAGPLIDLVAPAPLLLVRPPRLAMQPELRLFSVDASYLAPLRHVF